MEDSIACAAMIYPALTYRYNVSMLFCSFDDEQVRDEGERAWLLDATDLSLHVSSANVPQFVCYGTSDGMVGMDGAKAYISAARSAGAEIVEIAAEGQDHGIAQKYYMDEYLTWANACFDNAG